ncbi:MAG: ribose-phosphate diphosphokinase, partial [Synergistaceae bacterium]|nr:ribose-phosphate diphosphokinase [Synergistaceae bacterium]
VANFCELMEVIGSVKDKVAILVDDIIDTAGSLCNAAKGLIERGAKRIFACATHGVLSGPAIERLNDSDIEKVVITDTIPLNESKICDKINQLSIAPLFAEAIVRVHNERSISTLFEKT